MILKLNKEKKDFIKLICKIFKAQWVSFDGVKVAPPKNEK